jgi:hypothetical protein
MVCPLYSKVRNRINSCLRARLRRAMTLADALGDVEHLRLVEDRAFVLKKTAELLHEIASHRCL